MIFQSVMIKTFDTVILPIPNFHVTHTQFSPSLVSIYFNFTIFCLFFWMRQIDTYVYVQYALGMHKIVVHIYTIENRKYIRIYTHSHSQSHSHTHSIQRRHFLVTFLCARQISILYIFLDLNDVDESNIIQPTFVQFSNQHV